MLGRFIAVAALCFASLSTANGQEKNTGVGLELAAAQRLEAFEKSQRYCKLRLLTDAQFAASFIASNSGSVSDMCECAAMLATSSATDTEISATSTHDGRNAFTLTINEKMALCIGMGRR